MRDLPLLLAIVLSIAAVVMVSNLRKHMDGRIAALERELAMLRARPDGDEPLGAAEDAGETEAAGQPQPALSEPETAQEPLESEPAWASWADSMRDDFGAARQEDAKPAQPAAVRPPKTERRQRQPLDWERLLGVRLPIWLGAATLAVAGFFFISWLVESGVFTPVLRVLAGALAGVGFLAGAEIVRRRRIANGDNIASALAAAAIAIFYGTIFVAAAVFELIPEQAGFIGMALVTALAIAIALLYGQLVAVVGLLGGYAAPLFFASDEPSPALLFAYLTAIVIGIFWLMRARNWWGIRHAALAGPLVWAGLWAVLATGSSDMIPVTLFLIALALIAIFATLPHWDEADEPAWRPFKSTNAAAATLLSAVVAAGVGYLVLALRPDNTLFHIGFTLLSALVGAAAILRPVALGYLPVPLAGLAVAMLLLVPSPARLWHIGETLVLFAVFAAVALEHLRRGRDPVFWARLLSAIAVLFFLGLLLAERHWEVILLHRWIWTAAALAMAAGFAGLTVFASRRLTDADLRPKVFAAFTAAGTGFVSVAVAVALDPVLFPAAAALQVFGLSMVWNRFRVEGLRWLAAVYAVLYVGLLTVSLFGDVLRWAVGEPIAGSLVFFLVRAPEESAFVLLLLPGIAFIAAATLFLRDTRNRLASALDIAGVVMLALGTALQVYDLFEGHPLGRYGGALYVAEAGLVLALAWLGLRLGRPKLFASAYGVAMAVGLIALVGAILPVYEFWPYREIAGPVVFNTSLLLYGGPALMGLGLATLLAGRADRTWQRRGMGAFGVLALFTLVIVQVRYAFHPGNLQGPTSDLEFYTYSAAILLFGLALLVAGVAFRSISARALSMAFVLAAAGKVFLLDAEGLGGLWRVASFLGLGLSLLVIAWFYARFVFNMRGARTAREGDGPPAGERA